MSRHARTQKPNRTKKSSHPPIFLPDRHTIPNQTSIMSAEDITTLQRTVGNQQVLHLLREQSIIAREPAIALGLLNPAEVQSAISYHTSQPWKYTPSIIMQIQEEVGTTPTGKMTTVDVQAVAARQKAMNDAGETPELVVDGKAGPRTLPSIFKIGLAKQKSINQYSDKAQEILANPNKKTDQELALDLCAEANARLAALKIPPLEIEITPEIGGRGTFRAREWKLLLNTIQFTDDNFKDLKKTTATIYHEARHAEQAYRIAQMLAGKGNSVAAIVLETGIKKDIAEDAVQKPTQPGTMEALIAEGWHESLHSDTGKAKIRKNNAAMDKAFAEREAAKKAYEANPTPENKAKLEAAKAAYQKTIDTHEDFPHEFDAERASDKVKKQLG